MGLSRSLLRLSKQAEGYEQGQGQIRCLRRVINNARRGRGERVAWRRAEVAARAGGWGVHIRYDPPIDHWKLRSFAVLERLEQVREICGEQAYEERKRAWERASQPLVPSRFPSHDRPQHRGPVRTGLWPQPLSGWLRPLATFLTA